jgi:translocation and assembly module TamB
VTATKKSQAKLSRAWFCTPVAMNICGAQDPNPLLDITATRVIPNTGVEAQIRIQGTAREPQLTLSSDPPLDESDVLTLIVFNRSLNELGTGERASLAATAGGIATGFIAAPLGEAIGRALDLDIFEITTTTEEGEFGAGLTVGQQIGDRAFIRMRQQFGEFTATEFLLESSSRASRGCRPPPRPRPSAPPTASASAASSARGSI